MKTKQCMIIFFILTIFSFQVNAEWVSVDRNKNSNDPPKVTILSDDGNSTVIKIDISGFKLSEFMSDGKIFQSVDLLTEMFMTEPGYPALPYISKVLAIPDQSGVSVEVIEAGQIQIFKDIHLEPARESWFEGHPEPPYVENIDAYRSRSIYPQEYASVEDPAIFRDFRIARVSVFPFRYIAAKNEMQVVSFITVKVNYNDSDEVINPKTSGKKRISPSFAKLYRSFIFNYDNVLNRFYNGDEDGREVMLCIMPDEFVVSFQPYADWKRRSGTDVHVTKFSDIGANSSNPNIIKDHITDAYHNWEYPPTYVLIVGDDGVFPKKIVNYDYSFPSEDFFVEIDGNDFFPEMMIGRFTNQGDYRMRVMINKYEMYETEPYVAETDWFKNSICCSNNNYESQVATKRYTAQLMREDGGFTKVDTLMSDGSYGGYGCSMDINDIIDAINEGRSYLNYRGEGWSYGWYANCYDFETSYVSNLTNGQKFTFVTSIGCGVAMFDTYGGNCFGEEWIQLGSISEPRGGVAFVGPTSNTHTTYNNKIDKGIYVGMFKEGMDTPGQALLRGKLYMYNVYGNDSWVEYQYRVFCVLGDPSIHIWKDVPLEIEVDHISSIPVGPNQLEILTTFTASGLPAENAEVCVAGDESDIFVTSVCDAAGRVLINVTPETQDTLWLTVRGGNVIPYRGYLLVTHPDEQVTPEPDPLVVDIDGNEDGIINPNENCNITFTLKNWGTNTANNVEATLSVIETEYIQVITTDPIDFGNLSSGDSFTGNPYQFFIKPECPVDQVFTLQLHVSSNTSTWDYDINLQVLGCDLKFNNFMVNDEGSPNMNYRMDPGETVDLYFSIENFGVDFAPNIVGFLSSDDPYITIEDSDGSFGSLNVNEIAINFLNPFMVSIDGSCPTDYLAEYTLILATQDGNYPYQITESFEIPVSLSIPTDYTGPDAYGYYAYASTDPFFEQSPVFDWIEIEEEGIEINIPNNSNYTTSVSLPFDFTYYGIDYDQVRISTDGWIAFGSGTQQAPENSPLPNNDNVNSMVAPFWDDLYDLDLSERGEIFHYNDYINHRFIIEWDSIAHNIDGAEPMKEVFQVILLDPVYYPTQTGDGEIIFQYKRTRDLTSNTVGIENHTQDIGLQYVFNNNYDPTASEIIDSVAIKFTTEPPFITIVSIDENINNDLIPVITNLGQSYPNPFKSYTWITYSLSNQSNVSLQVFNIRGELVKTLHNGHQPAGNYSVEWNGINDLGNEVSSGVYFCRFHTDTYSESRKLILLK